MKLALALLTAQAVAGFAPVVNTKSAVSLNAVNPEFAEVGGEVGSMIIR